MSVIQEIINDARGLAVLKSWLGDGMEPVSQELANARAIVCCYCPHHRPMKWWEKFSKDPIAQAIKKELEVKHKVKLTVMCEDNLAMCSRCGCCMRLKVHVPLKHIIEQSPPEVLKKYPKNICWIKTEIEKLNSL